MDELGRKILQQFGIPETGVTAVTLTMVPAKRPELKVTRLVRDEEYRLLGSEIENYRVERVDA